MEPVKSSHMEKSQFVERLEQGCNLAVDVVDRSKFGIVQFVETN